MNDFDVVVIGGGHAGCEAASAAARRGSRVALITFSMMDLGKMSCNPAIGGMGKGHLVREVDVLGGLMGRCADMSAIQFRLLNRRKGPAVRGPRAQIDRDQYQITVTAEIKKQNNITILQDEVLSILMHKGIVAGVRCRINNSIYSRSVVITTGTFLRGIMYFGDVVQHGGRVGCKDSSVLGKQLLEAGISTGRLKTGTPPRLLKESIDFSNLDEQLGDEDPSFFSLETKGLLLPQVCCNITYTNVNTHNVIKQNLQNSAIYGGRIDSTGPRYCPSIEDKIVRFTDKERHQIFLEPEGIVRDTVYPNGISNSLPENIQLEFLRTIEGLEKVEVKQYGYAIEYDYANPQDLYLSLESRKIGGLFLAGQINGTTGYEEAGAQGLIAGVNASIYSEVKSPSDRDYLVVERHEGYIGVMIDDLISRGVSEPYRMFTSRAEYRLMLRADNAHDRLYDKSMKYRLVSEETGKLRKGVIDKKDQLRQVLKSTYVTKEDISIHEYGLTSDGKYRSLWDMFSLPEINCDLVMSYYDELFAGGTKDVIETVMADAKYSVYLSRQQNEINSLSADREISISPCVDYDNVIGLSSEMKQKLNRIRPKSLGELRQIDGITPAALALVVSASAKSQA